MIRAAYSIFFALLGVFGVVLFHADIYFPIWFSVTIYVLVSLYFLQQYRNNRLGILIILIWLVYVLPFIHIPPYIFFDFNSDPLLLWGLVVNPYMVDERVIALTAMIGAVGGTGVALGASFNNRRIQQDLGLNPDGSKREFRTMGISIWLVWVFIGVALTALSAPKDTIFTAAYTESKSALGDANFSFSSAWMISYVILTFAFCDTLVEKKTNIRVLKFRIIMIAILLVVVYFQLLRGDRESLSWVIGIVMAYYFWGAAITQARGFSIHWAKITVVVIGVFAISMIVGSVRSELSGGSLSDAFSLGVDLYESGSVGFSNIVHGTWSAVLLTPLSVAGDHIYGLLPVKWGKDYIDLILSIIPGFLADAIGYIRPIDTEHGPSWEMRYGLGGTHATVVPFMNFRMVGVFLIPTIWSYVMVKYEKWAVKQFNVVSLSLLVTIVMSSPHWLWYGEKYILNAILSWAILSFFYRVLVGMTPRLKVPQSLSKA